MEIKPIQTDETHKTGSLPSSYSVKDINKALGFSPNVKDDEYKVKYSWGFTVDGVECAIWDYRGARWSVWDPSKVLSKVFKDAREDVW